MKYIKFFYVIMFLLPLEYVAPGYCKRRRQERMARIGREHLAVCRGCKTLVDNVCSRKRGGCGCNMPLKLEKFPLAPCPKERW